MPRQASSRQQQYNQQPTNSFSASSESSTSYLSSRSRVQSPRSNFNPFSPISPHLAERDLGDYDDDSGAMFQMESSHIDATRVGGVRRVYDRAQLLHIAQKCRRTGWIRPPGLGSLESWYGYVIAQCIVSYPSPPPITQDPAIASVGAAPNRKNGGFGEGFGFGGGIGAKGISRGGRHAGYVDA
jgi:hypothetical protein